ncbi:MAG: hypothetical protein N2747_07870 [Chitinophagaceae bacterium]|nr:hypothetical protein [Chitinophagaceae bacterium]
MPQAKFVVLERLTDTAFESDTIFRDNPVIFKAIGEYDSVLWKVGDDPRDFTSKQFGLIFFDFLGTVPVRFTGYLKPDSVCFPNAPKEYNAYQNITLVEQSTSGILTKSPLVGQYKGCYTHDPTDSFIVRFEFFDSAKYSVSFPGYKNFYWISNFPKGYVSTESITVAFPELRQGRWPEMGYKCFHFGKYYQYYGYSRGWLQNHDTLIILNSGYQIPLRKFVGKRIL